MRVAICCWRMWRYMTKRAAQGIAECQHALALDRNLAQAHSFIGFGKIFIGRAEETEAHVAEALRLSPRDTMAYRWMTHAGIAKTHLGHWEQAVAWFRRSIEANRNFPHPHFVLGAALAQLGRLDEAHSAVKAGLALDPSLHRLPLSRQRGRRGATTRHTWPSLSPFSKACARLESPNNDRARRLAAILAADVVGYSRLMGEDEAGTALAVREHREAARPIVADHGGRIVKTTGDGLLLEFPSVVAAVECAIAIQKLMVERNAETPEAKRIVYRIGVNLGDVLIEGDDILGDGVNIAARLEGLCEPGGVLISGAAYDHVRGKIDAAFRRSRTDKDLKNIVRAGAGLFAQVGVPAEAAPASVSAPEKSAPPRLSIVVLPFANIGGDPEQEHFVDGVTESLTTDLSRIRGAVVIARNTAFTYKGKAVDVKTIGRELNVRYVLEGSVQRGGARMRVNVQLIDAETGNHLWAERFDKPLADLFDMQDEIVARLANALNAQLIAAEARRAEQAPNPDSMDLYFQGLAWYNKGQAPDTLAQARSFFDRALAADPDNVDALVRSAGADFIDGRQFVSDRSQGGLRGGRGEADQGLVLGPGPCARPYVVGNCRNMDQARGGGHRQM